jgi:excisionase family DNA binding protein
MEKLLTVPEAAAIVRMHVDTVYLWLKQERFPGIRVGGRWKIREASLRQWLDRREQEGE